MRKLLANIILFSLLTVKSFGATIIEESFSNSKIYPETVRNFKVSVPDNYNGEPLCLFVGLDGVQCRAPEVMDSLMATGDIPLMAGIYLEAGSVWDAGRNRVVRYNRSNEFDATDGKFARFLETEIIPAAVEAVRKKGINLNLKPGGDNAMIYGMSSGAIASFNAAMQRPDLFGRVFAVCGTFVPMRGGDGLAAIVRKMEPLPVRIFIQDNYDDVWNPLFGSWYEANKFLVSALNFAGYDLMTDWAEGAHDLKRASVVFPDALKWLWRDYPEPIKSQQSSNNALAKWLPGAGSWVKETASSTKVSQENSDKLTGAPAAFYPDGSFCVEAVDGSNYLWQYLLRKDGSRYGGQRFYWLHNFSNSVVRKGGMAFDADGYLWVLTDIGIQVCDQNGRVRGIFALPVELAAELVDSSENTLRDMRLEITDGELLLISPRATYRRKLGVRAAGKVGAD